MVKSVQPELSVVVASRNDDHGGNLIHRMQVFAGGLLGLCNKYQLGCELVVVEWNPPSDHKSLADELIWPNYGKTATVRFIEVPPEFHVRLPDADRMPLPQFEAKNVGIRRANGRYVLATNADILFSEPLMAALASGKLSPDCFYRATRYDVNKEIPLRIRVEEQLQFCEKHAARIYALDGTHETRRKATLSQLMNYIVKRIREIPPWGIKDRIHTNACGDFTLMAREHWHDLRGYPEIGSHAYVDGLICYMAASKGLRQMIFPSPMRIYHQEHGLGFDELIRQPHASPRPVMDYQKYRTWCVEMLHSKHPKITNDEGWGLGRETLMERTILV
jgi:hypothetical protein